jgi:ferritin
MLSETLQKALNDQINAELGSAYQYLAMSAHLEAANLQGSAKWMRRQSTEEVAHAMKIFDFVNDRGGRVTLTALPTPRGEYGSIVDVWESALKQEKHVTGLINALYELSVREKDFAAQALMQWFVTEQVEEEKTATTILEQARMIGATSSAIYFLDRHLGKEAEKREG